jgi:hypothetical protein
MCRHNHDNISGSNIRVHGQGNCSWKEGHNFVTSRCIHQENYWDMDAGIKKDIWSVMEDFAKVPGVKDLIKMKTQCQMFVDDVGSKQVTV